MVAEIMESRIMRGPNEWDDNFHKLIVLKLKIENSSNLDYGKITKKVTELLPLASFDGILQERDKCKLAVTIISTIAHSIQPGLEHAAGFAQCIIKGTDSYYGVYNYSEEETGLAAAGIAVKIFNSIVVSGDYTELEEDKKELEYIYEGEFPGPSTNSIIQEAIKRNIPVKNIGETGVVVLGYGKHQQRLEGSICETTSSIGVDVAGDKDMTKRFLADAFIPVPAGIEIYDEEEIPFAIKTVGYPLVVKPFDGNHGKGITVNINSEVEFKQAFHKAKEISRSVIVEKYISGEDYRFLVVNYKLVAAAKRTPASVIGDGVSTVQELIDLENKDPRRGTGHSNLLTRIDVNDTTLDLLNQAGMNLKSIPKKGVRVILKDTANISQGGTATDVTELVHPDNVLMAERAARIIGLDICGIDIVAPDIQTPFKENGGAIIEVNAAPGLRMHIAPSEGKPRNVGRAIIDLMFPNNSDGRIPIIAITGTNGKTTTSRLMANVVQGQGLVTGFTTTDGIYINGRLIEKGDCTGPKSTLVVLHDPSIEMAVLECARGGIIRSGLSFDQCDIAIVTNIGSDHLGMKDINTPEDMAMVKAVVPKSVKPDGYSILNADDDLVFNMTRLVKSKVAYFSLIEENPRIQKHVEAGGVVCYTDKKGGIWINDAGKKIYVEHVNKFPITLGGRASFNIQNVMPVVLASYLMKFDPAKVINSLSSFVPSAETTPGRLNIFKYKDIEILVDYAHNPHGLTALGSLLKTFNQFKTGIITGVGDRRDEDIIEVGEISAKIFDQIIIRLDEDTRGRDGQEIVDLLKTGIYSVKKDIKVEVIPGADQAIEYAASTAESNSMVVVCADDVTKTIKSVQSLLDENKG